MNDIMEVESLPWQVLGLWARRNAISKISPGEFSRTGAMWVGGAFSATPPYAFKRHYVVLSD